MSDTKKLRQIVDTLEEQSSRVNEFNGVLSAINDARKEIDSAKDTLSSLASEQKRQLEEMAALQFVTPEQYDQGRIATEAKFSEQFSKLSERVNAVSLGLEHYGTRLIQYDQGRAATEAKFSEQFSKLSEKVNAASSGLESCDTRLTQLESQVKYLESIIKSLRVIMVLGLIVLATGMAFLAVAAFM